MSCGPLTFDGRLLCSVACGQQADTTGQVISLPATLLSHHYLLHGAPIEDRTINEILDHIVMPLLRP